MYWSSVAVKPPSHTSSGDNTLTSSAHRSCTATSCSSIFGNRARLACTPACFAFEACHRLTARMASSQPRRNSAPFSSPALTGTLPLSKSWPTRPHPGTFRATTRPSTKAPRMKIAPAQARFGLELFVNLALPWLTYRLAAPHTTEFAAIAWSAAPPTLWSLAELIRNRTIDALSLLVLAGIALSLAALLFGGSSRMLMVRENLFTIPIGLLFLASLVLKKPLIYYAARATFARGAPDLQERFDANWQRPVVLHGLRVMSLVWGAGLVAQGALLGWMAWTWPVERYLILSPIIGYGMLGLLGVWTWFYRDALARRSATAA